MDLLSENAWHTLYGVLSVHVLVMIVAMMHAAGTGQNRPVALFAKAVFRYTAYIWAALIVTAFVSTVIIGFLGIYGFVLALMLPIPLYFWRNAGKV